MENPTSRASTPNHHPTHHHHHHHHHHNHTDFSTASPPPTELDAEHKSIHSNSLVADLERAVVSTSDSAAVAAAAVALDSGRNSTPLSPASHESHSMSLFPFSSSLLTSGIEARAGDSDRAASPNRAAAALSALLAGDRPSDSSKHSNHISVPPPSEPLRSVAQSLQSLQHMGSPSSAAASLHSSGLEALTGQSNTDPQLLGDSSMGNHTPQQKYASVSDLRTPTSDSIMGGAHSMFDSSDSRIHHQLTARAQDSPKSPSNKKHKCQFCDTVFTRHHNLKSHLLTHSHEKPFRCESCHTSFRRLHDLKRHAKLHTGEKPHKCSRCGRPFARGDALARHTKGPGGCAGRRASFGIDDDRIGRGGLRPGINGLNTSPNPMQAIDMGHPNVGNNAADVAKMSTALSDDSGLAGLADNFGRATGSYSTPTPTVTMYPSQMSSQVSSQSHNHNHTHTHTHIHQLEHRDLSSHGRGAAGVANMTFSTATLPYSTAMSGSPRAVSPPPTSIDLNPQDRTSPYGRLLAQNGFATSQPAPSMHSIPTDPSLELHSGAATPNPFNPARSPLGTNASVVPNMTLHSSAPTPTTTSATLATGLGDEVGTLSHHHSHAHTPVPPTHGQSQQSSQMVDHHHHHHHGGGGSGSGAGADLGGAPSPLLNVIKDLESQMTQIRDEYQRKVSELQDEVSRLQNELQVRQPQHREGA